MKFIVFDIETDALLNTVSKIHCLSYQVFENNTPLHKDTISGNEPALIKELFLNNSDAIFVGHNIIKYDIPVLEKLLEVELSNKLFDSLAVSYYLYPYRKKHGLEAWGEELGISKPKIEDWENQSLQDYIHRCESDVEINSRLFVQQVNYLLNLYDNLQTMLNFVSYLGFKMDCLKDQEQIGIKLDVDLANKHLNELQIIFDQKTNLLSEKMPEECGKILKERPKVMFKKNGELSVHGLEWIKYLKENNLPEETVIVKEKPNPGSDIQLKDWLFELGWKPITFKIGKKTKKSVPQVSLPFGAGLCPSVKDLYEIEPVLKELDGYFKVKHRIGVFKSYINSIDDKGKVYATGHGFTNTLRLTHSKPVVNLPKPGVFYGREIREVLTVENPDEYIMCGSDVSSLEDSTKQHYIYDYDPEYVIQMRVPGFDPHIDIGVLAGLITKEEEDLFKKVEVLSFDEKEKIAQEIKDLYKKIKKTRGIAKSANFAATYGAGIKKIAETAKISIEQAEILYKIYWKRNWAIKKIAENCIVKEVPYIENVRAKDIQLIANEDGELEEIELLVINKIVKTQKWLYNELSGYWLFLKNDKDKFSTLNQNTGVFVFDSWLYEVRKRLKPYGIKICLQYHDEILLYFKKEYKEIVGVILKESMQIINKRLKLNVEIDISVDYGNNYAECH